ncbi:Exportin-4 [Seminavis robusta]|uniref:Exportin-4 n=1 Tax=Seminavis robusta TaxID=568900 RepID=A0A9N8HBR2_9STRA|nr:Exportin-4 [Seminavis robusta]|eukprot:Sro375_g129370.1 Exportin-4 (1264) ;mRNA; f:7893-11788
MQRTTSNSGGAAKAELQRLLTTPPSATAGNANPSTVAHAALERLRDAGDEHYLFLRTLLEMTSVPSQQHPDDELLLFHCITGCRHVVLHGWRRFSTVFMSGLRDWMMLLGHSFFAQSSSSSRTLQVACYTTSVALWKRAWLEMAANANQPHHLSSAPDAQQQGLLAAMMTQQQQYQSNHNNNNTLPFLQSPLLLFQYLEHSMAAITTTAIPATMFLQALVEEFAGTKSGVTYQLPLEFHRLTRKAFENNTNQCGLNACLHLGMKTLSQILPSLSNNSNANNTTTTITIAQGTLQIICDILGWEFGDAFTATVSSSSSTLVRPPKEWSQHHLTTPALAQALWATHAAIREQHRPLAHSVRQLLVLLASLEGPIFSTSSERKDFLAAVLQGTLELLQVQVAAAGSWKQEHHWTELLDTLSILGRLMANGKWTLLIQFHKDPLLPGLLQGLTAIGRTLWEQHVQEAQHLQGNLEQMEYGDEREDVLQALLEAVVAVSGDPWLWYSGDTEQRSWARQAMGQSLGPLFGIWIQGRMQLAGWEEHYLCSHANDDVDEDFEYISAVQLEEEMELLSVLGRVHVQGSIQSLSSLFQQTIPQLQGQWNAPLSAAGVSPELAALLEQARLLTLYIGHLLTDDNSGETPVIPDTVAIACREEDEATIPTIVSAIEALFSLAQAQAVKLAENPNDPRLSPLLANSFLWWLNRWAPAYVYSVDYNSTGDESPANAASKARNIGNVWSSPEKAQQAVSFAVTLCLHFQCYWPQERPVQESAATLLLTLAKRAAGSNHQRHPSKIRSLMVASPSFTQIMVFHCLTAGTRHSMGRSELERAIHSKATEANASVDMGMVTGYQRLPYDIKSRVLTALLVACSEPETAALFQDCLKAVQDSFSSLLHALSTKQVSTNDIDVKEMTCLCVEMFRGVARASEMAEPARVPVFVTPNLAHLSGLMQYYAEDLTICERLLQFFRDYTEQFVIMLNREQCLALFQSSAELLRSYSSHHCNSKTRVIVTKSTEEANSEEEQKYGDILCAIQLLIHLGTKDFIDVCADATAPGVDSTQVTDVIFFGLQQILPLMTRGLLQMPTLCSQYFSLAGFSIETYPEKACVLPYELFDALMESLLFGMCHHDASVAKSSLQGIASITREHIKSQILAKHLSQNPGFIDNITRRLLRDVVFQNRVWDRLESAGMALLPLAAVDVNRFAAVVNELVDQVPIDDQKARLQSGFQSLIQPEVIQKVSSAGLEGRKNRIRFKKDFENFCHDVHSFLILK